MEINIHFTDEDWNRIEKDWTAWWTGELDRPMVAIDVEPPPDAELPFAPAFVSNIPLDMPAEEAVRRYQQRLEAMRFLGDAWPKWWLNFGPGIVAGFLGAQVHSTPDTVWFEPSTRGNIHDLHPAYEPGNIWWKRVRELTRVAVECWGDRISVGHTDLGGNLDILASLLTTEQLLVDLYDVPEEVARLRREITCLWLRYYDELYEIIAQAGRGTTPWTDIWSPGRCYMLQSDFSYMISPRMFERYVLPDLETCCKKLDHGFYHLDGKGELPHLDMLLSLERLHGIQWVPGDGQPPPEEWLPLLKRIREAGKLCQLMITPEGARTIVRELGGRGFAFHLVLPWTSQGQVEAYLHTLASEDISR
jgi:5-methyltetrahydrofolate--homocysteine methyltransferase